MTPMELALSFLLVLESLVYWRVKTRLAKAKRKTADLERLWLETWSKWEKTQEKLRKAQANRDMWQRQWTEGRFELDAATMATLADSASELEIEP